jgi:hypothetical protein
VFDGPTGNITGEERSVVGHERGAPVECRRGDKKVDVALDDATPCQGAAAAILSPRSGACLGGLIDDADLEIEVVDPSVHGPARVALQLGDDRGWTP